MLLVVTPNRLGPADPSLTVEVLTLPMVQPAGQVRTPSIRKRAATVRTSFDLIRRQCNTPTLPPRSQLLRLTLEADYATDV